MRQRGVDEDQVFAHRFRRRVSGGRPGLSGGVQMGRAGPLIRNRLIIGEPLAFDALEDFCGAHGVVNAEFDPVAVSEIEFCEIAAQMRFADRMIGSVDPPLEKAKKVLADVDRDNEASVRFCVGVFVAAVIDAAMLGELSADLDV